MNDWDLRYAHQDNGALIGPITEAKSKQNDGAMVTIVCITYKHEAFIAQALDSFLMQKTNFKFKIFVGEDCGPDHTADIIRDYAAKYPDIVVPFIREKNMGAQRNLVDLCQQATSPYIAFCEGDDYWIDEYKLQKQFDFMEKHKDCKVCCTKTEIDAPPDWHLRNWYQLRDGKYLMPDSVPGYRYQGEFVTPQYIATINVAHTSTHFYRWNYDLDIPEWYYEGTIGDTPMLLLQLGLSSMGFIGEVTSVYRINEGSIFFHKNREEFFLTTRLDMISWMSNFREYANKYFVNYPMVNLENRIKVEVNNYLKVLTQNNDQESIKAFWEQYSAAGILTLQAYTSFFNDSKMLTKTFSWEGYKLIVRNRYYRNLLRPYAKVVKVVDRLKNKAKWKSKNLLSFICYWIFSFLPKKKNIWCFSGFNKKAYMDNSKYLYEWVVENHPEIKAYWLTDSNDVYNRLKKENKPVLKMRSAECIKKLSRAKIAVTDHFVMSDYDNCSGFNNGTRVVQLWHGVGLKSIGDLKNTNVNGVMFSDDILSSRHDSLIEKIRKAFLYVRHAYYRELFEEYFMLVCPGPERVLQIAQKWNIAPDKCFFSGHPRNLFLHQQKSESLKILYAPTYRWNLCNEQKMINELIDSFDVIEQCMTELDGEFVIRLHPHTWRNYTNHLTNAIKDYKRIVFDHEKDIYQSLGAYSILISDYSSIAYDFILLDRPVIFYCPDVEQFVQQECGLNYDYEEYSPGPKTRTWGETMNCIREYVECPDKDSTWRCKVRDEFYDMRVNDENNSERIVREIKRRLKI